MSETGYSQKEVTTALNNAFVASMSPGWIGKWSRLKEQCIREYSKGLMAVLCENVDDDLLMPEELVAILMASAVFVHAKYTLGGKWKTPAAQEAKEIIDAGK